MNLIELHTFLTIVETRSLVRTSEYMNVTQSTVTARLKSLEETLGQTLIIRQKSGAILTPAGQRLKRYAETITELWQQARQETALPEGVVSVCNIGSHADLWPNLGRTLFDTIQKEHPSVALSVWHGAQGDLTTWLNSGLIDVSLTFWPTAQDNQSVFPLTTDKLILVSTNANNPIRFDPGYVFIEAGEDFGRQHAAVYSDANTAKVSFGSAYLGLDYILRRGGSAYLPKRIAAPYLANGELHHLVDAPEFERKSYLVFNNTLALDKNWLQKQLQEFEHI